MAVSIFTSTFSLPQPCHRHTKLNLDRHAAAQLSGTVKLHPFMLVDIYFATPPGRTDTYTEIAAF